MLKNCIPVLGYESWIKSPKLFVSEVLHNYTRGSDRQSGIWKTRTYLGDMSEVNNDANRILSKVKESLEYYLKKELESVEVVVELKKKMQYIGTLMEEVEAPFVTVTWVYQGDHDKLEDIDLNAIANISVIKS